MPSGQVATTALIMTVVALCVGAVLADQIGGRTVSLAVAGFLPISDASGFFSCANQVLDTGAFLSEWCHRRPIYPSLLATLLAAAGRNLQVALVLQAALVGLAIACAAREIARATGLAGFVLAVVVVFAILARPQALTLTMSENAGLLLGAVALVVLLRGAERGSVRLIWAGVALFGIAMQARPGAFVALPLLALWAIVVARAAGQSLIGAVALALLASGIGFAVQALLVWLTGGGWLQSHGPVAYVLYGMSVGGKTWAQVMSDHPEIFAAGGGDSTINRKIYLAALDNIRRDPGLLVRAYFDNLLAFSHLSSPNPDRWLRVAFRAAWLLGLVACARRWRDPRGALIGVLGLGEVVSAGFIYVDGGIRTSAVTVPATAALLAFGLSYWSAAIGSALALGSRAAAPRPRPGAPRLAAALALSALVALAVPHTRLRPWLAVGPLAGPDCEGEFMPVVVRFGLESPTLAIVAEASQASLWPLAVPIERLRSGFTEPNWFAADFRALAPSVLIYGYQRLGREFGRHIPLLWPGALDVRRGSIVRFCAEPLATVSLGQERFHLARSMTVLAPAP